MFARLHDYMQALGLCKVKGLGMSWPGPVEACGLSREIYA